MFSKSWTISLFLTLFVIRAYRNLQRIYVQDTDRFELCLSFCSLVAPSVWLSGFCSNCTSQFWSILMEFGTQIRTNAIRNWCNRIIFTITLSCLQKVILWKKFAISLYPSTKVERYIPFVKSFAISREKLQRLHKVYKFLIRIKFWIDLGMPVYTSV